MFYSIYNLYKYRKKPENQLIETIALNWGMSVRAVRKYLNMFHEQKQRKCKTR